MNKLKNKLAFAGIRTNDWLHQQYYYVQDWLLLIIIISTIAAILFL